MQINVHDSEIHPGLSTSISDHSNISLSNGSSNFSKTDTLKGNQPTSNNTMKANLFGINAKK